MKLKLLALIAFCIIAASVDSQILNIRDTLKLTSLNYGLVAYYPFTGNAGDSSGTGNHGSINGPILTTDRFGNPNSAYQFDGSNDYIEIADHNSLDLSDSFSITLWLNQYSSTSAGYRLFDKTTVGINDGYNFDTYDASGTGKKLRLTGGLQNAQASATFQLNTWNQVLVIHYKDSTRFYQNSAYIGKELQKSILTNSLTARIGGSHGTGNFFNGKIDEVRVYNRALCDLEIKIVYGTILTLDVKASKPSICPNTSTNINIVSPQPYMQYRLLKAGDSSQVGSMQTSACSDTLRFATGNIITPTSYIFRVTDPTNNQSIYLDTVISIDITPLYNDTIDTMVCGANGVFFNGQTRYNAGYYVGNFKSKAGCDSIVTLYLMKDGGVIYDDSLSICNGDSTYLQKAYRKTAGIYYDTIPRLGKCDSIRKVQLNIINSFSVYSSHILCSNDSVLVNGKYLKNSGFYYDTLVSAGGCDSILTTEITVKPTKTGSRGVAICSGDSLKISSNYYKTAGIYSDSIFIGNCLDSLISVQLTIVSFQHDSASFELCQGDIFQVNGKQVTVSGTYIDSLKNQHGCDSFMTYFITIIPFKTTSFNFEFCYLDSIAYKGNFYSVDTVFYDTLSTASGCDSIIITSLIAGGYAPVMPDSAFYCENKPVTLEAGNNYVSYLWNTGSTSKNIITGAEGWHWVTVKDTFNCIFTDSILVIERCGPRIFMPTSFTPNNNGLNDFLVLNAADVDYIVFQVFDRWGELVFESNNPQFRWDGSYKGYALPAGLYIWTCAFSGRNDEGRVLKKNENGILHIIK